MQKANVAIKIPAALHEAVGILSTAGEAELLPLKLKRILRLVHAVGALNAITESFPTSYGWRFISSENFTKLVTAKAQAGASAGELNTLYWRDTLGTIEAYTVMSVWRMVDICQAAFRCVEEDAIVPAAILARSALESSVQFVQDARTIAATIEQVLNVDMTANVVLNEELEAYLLSTVYASRQTGVEEIYKSKNILTVLEKIAKVAKDDPIKEEYELLCEVTHPNFLGRSTYIISAEEDPNDGSRLRTLGPGNGVSSATLLQSAIWALSWAIEAQASSTHLMQSVVRDLLKVLPQEFKVPEVQ